MNNTPVAVIVAILIALAVAVFLISKPAAPPQETAPKPAEEITKPEPTKPEEKPEEKPPVEEKPAEPEVKPQAEQVKLVEEVVFLEEADFAKAIDRIKANEIQLYASGTSDPSLERDIRVSELMDYEISYGSYTELTFNPVGPTFPGTGKLNPFSVRAIREAMNWLIDRDYIVEEIYGGLAVPKFFPISTAFPDYARLADVARGLEIEYAHDPERAKEIITREMEKLGAELVEGKWYFNGEPVEIIFLIRVEDERRDVGDYVATLLEDLGFTVDRQYKTTAEAAPLWISGDPAEGKWHIYTGGWITTVISRDQAGNFNFFYTPRGRSSPLWQAYRPTEEFDEIADRLARRDYTTLEERRELMARALKLALQDSVRVWLVDTIDVWPRWAKLKLAADLAGGVSGSWLWPYTLHFSDQPGGRVTFGTPSILTDPWNPIAGSNWIYDTMVIRATGELPLLPDPFTGLYWPQRVERAEVTVQEGLPVAKTHDWVTLKFEPTIEVPQDAWIDWDAQNQRFITVGEKYPDGLTSKTKTVIQYDDKLFEMRWHDGTKMSLGDLLISFILAFDRADEKSPIFDEAYVPDFETFERHFRGLRIVQEDPLIVEVYSDLAYLDAEWIVSARADYLFPYYDQGPAPWHTLALGILAEKNKELAFSSGKADKLKVEWMNYIAGPSLEILEKYRKQALKEGFIPYANTLGKYISLEEATERYRALGEWYKERGHFWVGQGPFYLDSVRPVEKIVVLRRFEDFPDPQNKWLRFSEPKIAEVEVSGPKRVEIGSQVEFQVEVSFKDEPYLAEDVDFARFLVFDAFGKLAIVGDAEAVRDGLWRVALTAEQTAALAAGVNRLEVVISPKVVSIPSFAAATFVTVKP